MFYVSHVLFQKPAALYIFSAMMFDQDNTIPMNQQTKSELSLITKKKKVMLYKIALGLHYIGTNVMQLSQCYMSQVTFLLRAAIRTLRETSTLNAFVLSTKNLQRERYSMLQSKRNISSCMSCVFLKKFILKGHSGSPHNNDIYFLLRNTKN